MSTHRICARLQLGAFSLNVDESIPDNQTTVIFGASGSGKTSLIRCIAGLEKPTFANIHVAGKVWHDTARNTFLPSWQRPLGYVFQESSLFDHLNVTGNLEFGLKRAGAPRQQLDEAIHLLGIEHLLKRRPSTLSGGERQRVAIARALCTQPALLLLDEPLASLDQSRKDDILPWIEKIRNESRISMLYITHSVDELGKLADHLILMQDGRVVESGSMKSVLSRPAATRLLGDESSTVLSGVIVEQSPEWQLQRIRTAAGDLWIHLSQHEIGQTARIRIRARDLSIGVVKPYKSSIQNVLEARIIDIREDTHASQQVIEVSCNGCILIVKITRRACHELALKQHQEVWLQLKSAALCQ